MHFPVYAAILLLSFVQNVHAQTSVPVYDITLSQAWTYALLSGLGLLIMGLLAALLIIGMQSVISQQKFKIFINLLYSLGCGAMVGDAMFHILPDCYQSK